LGRIVGVDSDTAVLPRASRTSLPCCIPSRGYTPAGRLRGSVQTMADFQIHSKQKLFPPFNSMVTPCCLVHCFGEMSCLHVRTRNAVRTGKKVIQIQRGTALWSRKSFHRIGTYLPNYTASRSKRPLSWFG